MHKLKYLLISFFVILFDQVSKYEVRHLIKYGQVIKVTPKFLWITHITNKGAAFSLSFGSPQLNRIIFLVVGFFTVFIISYLGYKSKSKIEMVAFSLIIGGAFGNLIDRIFNGGVTDFIWTDFPDIIMERWPIFNVADSSIVIALGLIIIESLFFAKKTEV